MLQGAQSSDLYLKVLKTSDHFFKEQKIIFKGKKKTKSKWDFTMIWHMGKSYFFWVKNNLRSKL